MLACILAASSRNQFELSNFRSFKPVAVDSVDLVVKLLLRFFARSERAVDTTSGCFAVDLVSRQLLGQILGDTFRCGQVTCDMRDRCRGAVSARGVAVQGPLLTALVRQCGFIGQPLGALPSRAGLERFAIVTVPQRRCGRIHHLVGDLRSRDLDTTISEFTVAVVQSEMLREPLQPEHAVFLVDSERPVDCAAVTWVMIVAEQVHDDVLRIGKVTRVSLSDLLDQGALQFRWTALRINEFP